VLPPVRSVARIDFLTTHIGLPGSTNGRQVADAARALRPGIKVLFVTRYAENAAIGLATRCGLHDDQPLSVSAVGEWPLFFRGTAAQGRREPDDASPSAINPAQPGQS
jgi:DNA-binding NarL/FixJ family response regulator